MGMRPQRVAELVLRELGDLFGSGKIKDPDIGFVTFTGVDMSPDLRLARVYFSVYGESSDLQATENALGRARGFVRRELGQRLRLKVTPNIEFLIDRSLQRGARIDELLREVHNPIEDPEKGEEG